MVAGCSQRQMVTYRDRTSCSLLLRCISSPGSLFEWCLFFLFCVCDILLSRWRFSKIARQSKNLVVKSKEARVWSGRRDGEKPPGLPETFVILFDTHHRA